MAAGSSTPPAPDGHVPAPPSERGAWIVALALLVLGVGVLGAVLGGGVGQSHTPLVSASPPPVVAVAPTPAAAGVGGQVGVGGLASRAGSSGSKAAAQHGHRGAHAHPGAARNNIVARPSTVQQRRDLASYEDLTGTHISTRWMEGFYPIYEVAQSTFAVNWLLLASIHKQESAFSTAPSTYHGLNFAGCCGGPMQFNVTNGPVSTWQLVSNSYVYGTRPAVYNHQTNKHPSIYDDFDALMAAARLLSSDGAGYALDGSAWNAAYDYYGHDATGVTYADQVLARAIGWSQHGFCINCGLETSMVEAVDAAYGAPVLEALTTATAARTKSKPKR
jgi:hypothetical protein